jgi:hypothetical protein
LAVTDGSLALHREEMPIYWRLFAWSDRQSVGDLHRRSKKLPVVNDFALSPDEQRGKLFELDLNVRRVLAYDAPENLAGVKKVYEIWGFTNESQAWPYVVVTAQLPKGMPVGTDVFERVRFSGYFLKLQGYHEAGASPHDKALSAPLFVGKLSWIPNKPVAVNPPAPRWVIWVGLAICGMVGVRLFLFIWKWKGQTRTSRDCEERPIMAKPVIDDWLAQQTSESDAAPSPIWTHTTTNGSAHSNYSSPSDN